MLQPKSETQKLHNTEEGGKAQQAKLHPKTAICNLLITLQLSHDYRTVYEEQIMKLRWNNTDTLSIRMCVVCM